MNEREKENEYCFFSNFFYYKLLQSFVNRVKNFRKEEKILFCWINLEHFVSERHQIQDFHRRYKNLEALVPSTPKFSNRSLLLVISHSIIESSTFSRPLPGFLSSLFGLRVCRDFGYISYMSIIFRFEKFYLKIKFFFVWFWQMWTNE